MHIFFLLLFWLDRKIWTAEFIHRVSIIMTIMVMGEGEAQTESTVYTAFWSESKIPPGFLPRRLAVRPDGSQF